MEPKGYAELRDWCAAHDMTCEYIGRTDDGFHRYRIQRAGEGRRLILQTPALLDNEICMGGSDVAECALEEVRYRYGMA